MGASVPRILISGYYGFDNSGDEAVLLSIIQALRLAADEAGIQVEPVVLSGNPAETEAMYGVSAVPRMQPGALLAAIRSCSGLISGGGSLLQDVTGNGSIPYYLGVIKLAQWFGKPTFIYSQGIGPVQRPVFQKLIASVFNRTQFISVRDAESAELLRGYGVRPNVEVVPDPVMGMRSSSDGASADQALERAAGSSEAALAASDLAAANIVPGSSADRPVIGVSVRYWREDRADLQQTADLLSRLCESHDARLLFLPFHEPHDREASSWVIERLSAPAAARAEIAPPAPHPLTMLNQVAGCTVLIGMRLHALIYAASQRVPLAGISYDPKIDRFLAQIASTPIGTTDRIDLDAAILSVEGLLANPEDWKRAHAAEIDSLIKKSQQPAQHIAKLLRQIQR
ncbi:polysaccharide pyruvyl transferase CsaB [Xylanibacillus composti]|uniref:Polysaccharide pyruvyl transferase CsaB n=1 Tax=Xylanibacillus composti TaxID=1572762 RepID=A0A8J4H8A6_9BACL|nr:polysaccharide pyruvyl transferase CsaB [Xylanibacillus composti]MDT9725962.1 polysaccharide pyruvyl transferase CsaB [Xylanibacillus composti]GIQ70884.1 polysaccharide pyruvyl transferase CsaB [Xylanibacillus composti]